MCHQISWYYALCFHQNTDYNIPILCEQAIKLGYECYNPECTLLPFFGACRCCKHREAVAKGINGSRRPNQTEEEGCRYVLDSLISPETLDASADVLFDKESESGCGVFEDDSGVYLGDEDKDGTGLSADMAKDDLDKEWELFDMITF